MMMTLEEERRLLAKLREPGAIDLMRSLPGPPVALRDQIDAAARETRRRLPDFGRNMPGGVAFGPVTVVPTDDARALIAAAAVRCLCGHACPHAHDGGRPLLVLLNARAVSCRARDCLAEVMPRIEAANAQVAAGDDICDLCLEHVSPPWFFPVVITAGPGMLVGDVCESCRDITKGTS